MVAGKTFTYNGTESSDYDMFISGDGVYNSPEKAYEMVTVPGRNGAVALDEGRFENAELRYPAFIYSSSQANFRTKLAGIRDWLLSPSGYVRLEDDYHPDEYRLALFRAAIDVDPVHYNEAAQFELVFDCKPQRFLTDGETAVSVSSGDTLENPTGFASQPLLAVTGAGTLYVGDYSIVISTAASNPPLYIDCEIMEAYEINSNGDIVDRNSYVAYGGLVFPKIEPGEVEVTYSGITALSITPNWWRI